MIIVQLSGGLGNQMFQYAFGRAMAIRLDSQLLVDLSDPTLNIHNGFELERVFMVNLDLATSQDMKQLLGWQSSNTVRRVLNKFGLKRLLSERYLKEPHYHFSKEFLNIPDDVVLNGHWQSEKYFFSVSDVLRGEFSFRNPPSDANRNMGTKIADQPGAISLHVRRGDYVNNVSISQIHPTCSLQYYQNAVRYMVERVSSPYFFIFSDDVEWTLANLDLPYPSEVVLHNRGKSSYEDMRLMSLCKHNIIANSSFSWWGAWLNNNTEKKIVAPKCWFSDDKVLDDLFPEGWVVL